MFGLKQDASKRTNESILSNDSEPVEYYAIWRSFAALMDQWSDPVGDVDALPASKSDIETALFLSFNGITNKAQFLGLKKLIVELGSFIELTPEDRRSIAACRYYGEALKGANEAAAAAIRKLMAKSTEHYKTVLSRSLRSATEMHERLDAYVAHFKLAERFYA